MYYKTFQSHCIPKLFFYVEFMGCPEILGYNTKSTKGEMIVYKSDTYLGEKWPTKVPIFE